MVVARAAQRARAPLFAMFDLTQHVLIEGEVSEWNYNNPHSWLHIQGLDKNGELKTWSFEGAAVVHAARQGVNGATFKKGEHVKVIASPLSDGRTAGAMCFVVKQDGSIAQPNDGICNAPAVIAGMAVEGLARERQAPRTSRDAALAPRRHRARARYARRGQPTASRYLNRSTRRSPRTGAGRAGQ
jgi:hypothetical protein